MVPTHGDGEQPPSGTTRVQIGDLHVKHVFMILSSALMRATVTFDHAPDDRICQWNTGVGVTVMPTSLPTNGAGYTGLGLSLGI